MKILIYTIILVGYQLSGCMSVMNNSTKGNEDICNKSDFVRKYVRNDLIPSRFMLNATKTICNLTGCGNSAYPFIAFGLPNINVISTGANFMDESENCWGYIFKLSLNGTVVLQKYVNFLQRDGSYYTVVVPYNLSTRFEATLTSLPNVAIIKRYLTGAKSVCGLKVAKKASTLYWRTSARCQAYSENLVQVIADQFCQHYNENDDYAFNRTISVKRCTLVFKDMEKYSSKNKYSSRKIIAPITLSVSIIFLVAVLIIWKVNRTKSESKKLQSQQRQEKRPHLKPGQKPKIMIIHRPGCDLLDAFVRDLAYVLKSFDIDATCALLEQSSIDAQGGIASYTQKYIDSSDYIFILLTEGSRGAALYKQKPFEYSLRMLGGLAFSTDHASRYIPLYLNSYKKTLHLLPPFLFASANCGYEIPAELESLIAHIRQKKIVADAETELKMKFFSKKMRSQAKKILKPVHAECFAAKCALGVIDDDKSELWASETRSTSTFLGDNVFGKPYPQSCNSFQLHDTSNNSNFQSFNNVIGSSLSVTQIINKNINIQCWRNHCYMHQECAEKDEKLMNEEETCECKV